MDEALYNEIMDVAKSEVKKEDLVLFYEKYAKKI